MPYEETRSKIRDAELQIRYYMPYGQAVSFSHERGENMLTLNIVVVTLTVNISHMCTFKRNDIEKH